MPFFKVTKVWSRVEALSLGDAINEARSGDHDSVVVDRLGDHQAARDELEQQSWIDHDRMGRPG